MTPAEAVTTVQAVVRSCPRVPFMTCGSKLSTATVRGMWMVVHTASSSNPYVNLVRPVDPEGGLWVDSQEVDSQEYSQEGRGGRHGRAHDLRIKNTQLAVVYLGTPWRVVRPCTVVAAVFA